AARRTGRSQIDCAFDPTWLTKLGSTERNRPHWRGRPQLNRMSIAPEPIPGVIVSPGGDFQSKRRTPWLNRTEAIHFATVVADQLAHGPALVLGGCGIEIANCFDENTIRKLCERPNRARVPR